MKLEKSRGHGAFLQSVHHPGELGLFELFRHTYDGDWVMAPVHNWINLEGFREGARFQVHGSWTLERALDCVQNTAGFTVSLDTHSRARVTSSCAITREKEQPKVLNENWDPSMLFPEEVTLIRAVMKTAKAKSKEPGILHSYERVWVENGTLYATDTMRAVRIPLENAEHLNGRTWAPLAGGKWARVDEPTAVRPKADAIWPKVPPQGDGTWNPQVELEEFGLELLQRLDCRAYVRNLNPSMLRWKAESAISSKQGDVWAAEMDQSELTVETRLLGGTKIPMDPEGYTQRHNVGVSLSFSMRVWPIMTVGGRVQVQFPRYTNRPAIVTAGRVAAVVMPITN